MSFLGQWNTLSRSHSHLPLCTEMYWTDPNNIYGENLASISGTGITTEQLSTDSVLTRWVEDEEDDPYPQNGHLTQVLWRSSENVGCGEASKPISGGGMCHVQVCRYARPGRGALPSYKMHILCLYFILSSMSLINL